MSLTLALSEARDRLDELVDRAERGEVVVITREGREAARLMPPAPEPAAEAPRPLRKGGWMKGQIWMAPDFDETPQEIIDLFEGKEAVP